jgi:hypothetical protein
MEKRYPTTAHSRRVATIVLPEGLLVEHVADACREAFVSFLQGVATGWGKAELGRWLAGPYRELCSFSRVAAAVEGQRKPVPKRVASFDDDQLNTLARTARWKVLAALEGAMPKDNDVSFASAALYARHIVRCADTKGRAGWAPTDASAMRLSDRVLSLVAVDYLVRSEDYESKLAVCHFCERVWFDEETRKRGACRSHGSGSRASGMRPREEGVPSEPGLGKAKR